jgi:hypothetical protein
MFAMQLTAESRCARSREPKASININEDVSVSLDASKAKRFNGSTGELTSDANMTAVVLRVRRTQNDLAVYAVAVFTKGRDKPLGEQYRTIESVGGQLYDVMVFGPIMSAEDIAKVQITRQLFAMTRFNNVQISGD